MKSKRYPEPRQQIEAGYFWLTIGLTLSLLIVLTKPVGRVSFMFGFIGFGLFHLFFGKRNLRKSNQMEPEEDDRWWESDSEDHYDENGMGPNGFDWLGLDSEGFDQSGFDVEGYDRQGLDRRGMDRRGNIPEV
jgi:hypothetical protein